MPTYVIVMQEGPLRDHAAYEQYRVVGRQNPPPATMKPLAIYGAIHPLEGTPPEGAVILEFPTVEDAKAWYYGPYQAAAPHRIASGDWRAIILEGL